MINPVSRSMRSLWCSVRLRVGYANVMATVAVFIALGGTSYAALMITGANVRNGSLRGIDIRTGSVPGKDIANGTITDADVLESSLGTPLVKITDTGTVSSSMLAPVPAALGVTGSANLPNSVVTTMPFASENFDTVDMLNLGTETFTIPVDGIYELSATANISAFVGTGTTRQIGLVVNTFSQFATYVTPSTGAPFNTLHMHTTRSLSAGDTVSFTIFQDSGSTLTLYGSGVASVTFVSNI